jgi:LmbE family N-acetylglucosaminyl deacetylase
MTRAIEADKKRDLEGTRLLCVGAHPDDSEAFASGLAALCTSNGGTVRFLAVTDGTAGHPEQAGATLARRRQSEAQHGATIVGADTVILANPDGGLVPQLEQRLELLREIRLFAPDVIATHRVNDYHPDHRYTGTLVQDAWFTIRVPNVLPGVAVPPHEPTVLYMSDQFTRPRELQADLIFDIDGVIGEKLEAMIAHVSQVEEWLPWMAGYEPEIVQDPVARRAFLLRHAALGPRAEANRFRPALVKKYGATRGARVEYAEAFEISEFSAPMSADRAGQLFPY